jgi:hypothetical protein
MIWLRVSLCFDDARDDIELACVDPALVRVKPGEKFGPCLSLPVKALPLQPGVNPPLGWTYWDGECWRLCPESPDRKILTSGGEAIDAAGIAGIVVLPDLDRSAKRARLQVSLYEKDTQ